MTRIGDDCPEQALVSLSGNFLNWGAPSGKYSPHRNLSTKHSSLSRSWAEVKPHHTGKAYNREAVVVMQVLSSTYNQGFFCVGTRGYGVPGNENDESIVCMSVLY